MFPRKVFVKSTDVTFGLLSRFSIVDVRSSLADPTHGFRAFEKSRIQGAVFACLDNDLSHVQPTVSSARHPLPEAESFIRWCQYKEVAVGDAPVLCYDDNGGAFAARLWWMLRQLNVDAYILDGGIQAYTEAGLPVDTNPPTEMAKATHLRDATESHSDHYKVKGKAISPKDWKYGREFTSRVSFDQIPPEAQIIDGRPGERFSTTVRPLGPDVVPGHLPGAVSHPWLSNVKASATAVPYNILKDDATLKQQFQAVAQNKNADGPVFDSATVFMCGSGVTACHNIASATHVGLVSDADRPRMYDGSWSEVGSLEAGNAARREALDKHGVLVRPAGNPMVPLVASVGDEEQQLIAVGNAAAVPLAEITPPELQAVLQNHLRVNDSIVVTFKDGREFDVRSVTK